MSNDETAQEAGNFARQTRATFPVVHDPKSAVYAKFGVEGAPTNIVIDRKGRVVFAQMGENIRALEAAVARAMAAR